MIKAIFGHLKSNIVYTTLVLALLALFTYHTYVGSNYFQADTAKKNAGYGGVVPHSGYGMRFYHK